MYSSCIFLCFVWDRIMTQVPMVVSRERSCIRSHHRPPPSFVICRYGFSKVRRGPDIDMYAHPAFQRGKPCRLSSLRKLTTAAERQRAAEELAESVAQQHGEQEQPKAMYQGLNATNTNATATAAPPMTPRAPRRSVSATSTDYFSSSSFSFACYDTSSSTTSEDSEENGTASVTGAYNGISISDLIQTYQKSVDARPVSSSSSVASSAEVSASTTTTNAAAECHHSSKQTATFSNDKGQQKRRHSADSLEDNKLALLALAMTSMAGQDVPS